MKVTKSDHNTIITKFSEKWDKQLKKEKVELFNMKNPEGQQKFKEITSTKGLFTNIFEDKSQDVNSITNRILKKLDKCLHKCFNKIRVKEKENKKLNKLFETRRALRIKFKEDKSVEKQLDKVEEELANIVAEDNYAKIKEELKDIDCNHGAMNAGKLWKIKKKLSPRQIDTPTAMLDRAGNLVTSVEGVKNIASEHYTKVLENRPINDKLKHIQTDKEDLFRLRLDLAKANKSKPWEMQDLEAVLKYLKNNKSRDPLGNANELFKINVSGKDLKLAILMIMNKIKEDQEFPDTFRMCNISSIFKKGKRSDFNNYRGIFRVTILRSILDRLVYNDIYPVIDSSLTDANVGSRKERNVRDNLFVLYAIINSIKKGGEEPCDLGVYDVIKCFDSLWNQDCINDMWDAGCQNDKLHILSQGNEYASVVIKTPGGNTKRINISNIIMQGTVNSRLFCTCTMDKFAKMVYQDSALIYKYKGVTDVPPLEMVDDILTISKCSITSVAMNATLNAFMENKKLKLSQEKCSALHVGKSQGSCHELKVHGETMHQVESTKYLGDVIHQNGKLAANIAERYVKAVASLSVIRAILQDIPLGKYRAEIGLELRQALFVNSVLNNCETWHSIKDTDILKLNIIDHQLLRFICNSHAKTPVEFLFLETGATPLSFIITNRRLNYLHTILSRNDQELIKRVYKAQKENPSPGDFVELIKKDFAIVNFDIEEDCISGINREAYKKHTKTKVKEAALKYLKSIQEGHSKVQGIKYETLATQPYLKSPFFSNSECNALFAIRSHTLRGFKGNTPSIHKDNMSCPLKCDINSEDVQEHILKCQVILSKLQDTELEDAQNVEYNYIYGDTHKQKAVVTIILRLLELRNNLLEQPSTSTPASGASLVTASLACLGSDRDKSTH